MGNSIVITRMRKPEAKEIDKASDSLSCSMQDFMIAASLIMAEKVNDPKKKIPAGLATLITEVSER